MQIASQKSNPFYFNSYGEHSYKSELRKSKDMRKDKINEFSKYFLSFKALELDEIEILIN